MKTSHISDLLDSWVREKALKPGDRLPSARELAGRWGVSRPMVSRVLHQMEGAGILQREGYKWRLGVPPQREDFVVHAFIRWPVQIEAARHAIAAHGGMLRVSPHETMRKTLLSLCESPPLGIITTHPEHLDLLAELEAAGTCIILCHHAWQEHSFVKGDYPMLSAIAVAHFHALGHREICCLIRDQLPSYRPIFQEVTEGYRAACWRNGLRASARRIVEVGADSRTFHTIFSGLLQGPRRVTAVLCSNDPQLALALLDYAAENGIRVPEDLSIITAHESPECATCTPPLTAVGSDGADIVRIAANLLCDDIHQRRQRLGLIRNHGVTCQPTLTRRASTAPPPGMRGVQPASRHGGAGTPREVRWSNAENERLQEAQRLNACRYVNTAVTAPDTMHPLDLSKVVNRALGPRASWLGDLPLLHFEPGEHEIHGIPFQVCRGRLNPSHAALVLRSARARTSTGKSLPVAVALPVNRKVRAIYFLHAAGWVDEHACIANYHFHFQSGRIETLPVFAYGARDFNASEHTRKVAQSVVQDWHPSMEPFHSHRALPHLVTEAGDPLLYERYLYTCQWTNPNPGDLLKKIMIESADPDSEATLALLAVTVVE